MDGPSTGSTFPLHGKPVTSPPDDDGARGAAGSKKRKLNTGRTSQACTRCRSLKMKCIGATDPPCRRCRRTGATCDFVPRANAARPWSPGPYPSHTCTELWRTDVTTRLKTLEAMQVRFEELVAQLQSGVGTSAGASVGLGAGARGAAVRPFGAYPSPQIRNDPRQSQSGDSLQLQLQPSPEDEDEIDEDEEEDEDESSGEHSPRNIAGVLTALERLKAELPGRLASADAWAPNNVGRLWESFRSHMPGLHFFSGQVSFTHPTPLLAVAILYVATAHHPAAELARHGQVYFQAFTRAVATLALPDCPLRGKLVDEEDTHGRARSTVSASTRSASSTGGAGSSNMDDVLGIILVGLLAVGWVDTVGMWVNTAYRLLLDGMAEERGMRQAEWRGLWEGLRTIELEHSSLHLICPALPVSPPDPPFTRSSEPPAQKDAGGSIGELLQIMQRRMPRFVGRGLPTVWESVCDPHAAREVQISATTEDMDAMRAWASEIDEWYTVSAADTAHSSLYVRAIILLNYHLHKLFVLSIFFPLRGLAYAAEADDSLLESCRVVLKIEASGFEVWSSWDLVMVTNASLILLEAWAAGSAGQDDLNLIQNHLNLLTCTQQTAPSLRHTLATRLETALQQVRTPVRTSIKLPNASPAQTTSDIVNRWSYPAIMSSRPNGRGGSARGHPLGGHHPHAHAHAHAHAHSRGSSGRATPSASGFLFMDHAPNLGILPDLPTVDVEAAETSVAEWPPFLLNLFGEPDPNESTS